MTRSPDSSSSGRPPSSPPPRLDRRAFLALGGVVLSACGGARGAASIPVNSSEDPYATVRAQADELYRQGLDHYRLGEYRKALDAFQRAKLHDPSPRPDIDEMIRRTQEALVSGRPAAPPTASPVAASPTAAPTSRPAFVSRVYNYAITYPPGWRAEGATTRVGSTLLDLYAEDAGAGSALIFGFPPPDGASQDALIRQSLALRQKMSTPYKRVDVREVNDAQAVVVTYSEQREDGVWLAVRQALFQRAGTCWVVAVAAPATDAERYGGILDQMLDGFRVSQPRA